MPESTCLHIQDRESGPIRVVELPWISVRIGRAAYCEIRLPDEQVAEEACRLTRRGRTWSLVPSSDRSPILFEGRPLAGPCPLPFDVPFRMGPYCLTLRHDVGAEPDWELYPATAPALSHEPRPGARPELSPPVAEPSAAFGEPEAPAAASPGTGGKPARDPDRWHARWKAAEAHFKSRASRMDSAGGQRPACSAPTDAPRGAGRPLTRPPASTAPPVPPPRPAPTPSAPRVEPIRNVPRPEPKPAAPRLGPALRPTPWPAAGRTEPFEPPRYQPPAAPAASETAAVATPEAPPLLETEDWSDLIREAVIATTSAPGFEHGASFDTGTLAVDPQPEATPPPPIEPPADLAPPPILPAEPDLPTEPDLATAPSAVPTLDAVEAVDEPAREAVPEAQVSPAGPPRPIERGPKRRRPRERPAAGRRGEPARRSRPEPAIADPAPERGQEPAAAPELELPSVRDILANHRNSPGPRPAVERRRAGRHAVPTIPQEPAHWDLPAWVAVPPVGVVALGAGLLGCVLSLWWSLESTGAAVVTQRLMAADSAARRKPMPPGVAPSGGRWIKTTAEHLADWAIYTAGIERDEPAATSEVPSLVARALEISPLNPTARLARAQLEGSGRDGSGRIRGLGLSRDSVSLAWSARRLLDSGKKEAALRLYARAISAAVEGGLSRSATPRFAEEPMNRYYLPAEDKVLDIVAELAARRDLRFREWSAALPRHPTVLLATARLLRERGDSQADSLLDDVLGDGWSGPEIRDDPRLTAARAEALGLRSRWKEAAEQYRLAIERVDNDLIRRSWWFNLAEIAQRLNDDGQRQTAFRAVLAAHASDDISRRVGQIQRAGEARIKAKVGYGSLKAN